MDEGVVEIRCDVNGGSWYKVTCLERRGTDRVAGSGMVVQRLEIPICRLSGQLFSGKLVEVWEYLAIKSLDDLEKNLCH